MIKILLLYSTYDGHTREIANKVAAQLKRVGCAFDLFDFNQLPTIVLADYNAVLIAAAIRYGHFHESVIQFVKTHRILLNTKLTAFGCVFGSKKPNRQLPDHNIYLKNSCAAPSGIQLYVRLLLALYGTQDTLG